VGAVGQGLSVISAIHLPQTQDASKMNRSGKGYHGRDGEIMQEKKLVKISMACSISGLILLFFVTQQVEIPLTEIASITPDDMYKSVRICGNVTHKYVSVTKHVFLDIKDQTGKIDVVFFNRTAEDVNVYEVDINDFICISGAVDEWKGKLEIIGNGFHVP
jgi:DNA/RNA endonuclease YhcR with UshA esterase domain